MRFKITTAFLTAGILALAPVAIAKPCRDSGDRDCLVLRVKAQERSALLQAYGLELLRQLDSEDPDLVLVAAPENIPAELAEELVRGDLRTIGVEPVTVASLSESALTNAADGSSSYLQSFTRQGEDSGPLAAFFEGDLWRGYTEQPATEQISLHETHALANLEARGAGSVVAIIDTGVDPDHPVLRGALVPGYDFLLDEPGFASEWPALDPTASTEADLRAVAEQSYTTIVEGGGASVFVNQSYTTIVEQSYTTIVESQNLPQAFGHGTMTAGIVRLVAPAAKIMPLRVFNGDGTADLSDVIEAIRFAVRNGANVINMSFSTSSSSPELLRAVRQAVRRRVVLVTSTGNEGLENLTYPAAYGGVFGVASVDADNQLSEFSNHGPDMTLLAAPGEEVITAFPGGLYAAAWGTSFAAPFVSGTAALLHRLAPPHIQRIRVFRAQGAFEDAAFQPDPGHPSQEWGAGILDTLSTFANTHPEG